MLYRGEIVGARGERNKSSHVRVRTSPVLHASMHSYCEVTKVSLFYLTKVPVEFLLSRTASGRRRRPGRGRSANLCRSLRAAASCHRWCAPTQRLRKVTEIGQDTSQITNNVTVDFVYTCAVLNIK